MPRPMRREWETRGQSQREAIRRFGDRWPSARAALMGSPLDAMLGGAARAAVDAGRIADLLTEARAKVSAAQRLAADAVNALWGRPGGTPHPDDDLDAGDVEDPVMVPAQLGPLARRLSKAARVLAAMSARARAIAENDAFGASAHVARSPASAVRGSGIDGLRPPQRAEILRLAKRADRALLEHSSADWAYGEIACGLTEPCGSIDEFKDLTSSWRSAFRDLKGARAAKKDAARRK